MKKVLVAGATGYLGQFVVKALKAKGYWVRALGRSAAKLAPVEEYADELSIGEVTDPESLNGLCDGVDIVFSSVGITRQKDGLTYNDVDYQANRNLLTIAEASAVSKFMYVHVLNAEKLRHVAMIQAKQAFIDELKRSRLDHVVICPTGFFSDMEEILSMAHSGRVYLFGDGSSRINPIHGADLAEVCATALGSGENQIEVGGPEVLTYREIAELAFDVLGKNSRPSGRLFYARNAQYRVLTRSSRSRHGSSTVSITCTMPSARRLSIFSSPAADSFAMIRPMAPS